jgi:hypothetical protein
MSSTSEGSIFERSIRALKAPTSISAAAVSLKPPLPPFVIAVRRHAVTTIYHAIISTAPILALDLWSTYVVGVLLKQFSTSARTTRSGHAIRASKVAGDLGKTFLSWNSGKLIMQEARSKQSYIPADMIAVFTKVGYR